MSIFFRERTKTPNSMASRTDAKQKKPATFPAGQRPLCCVWPCSEEAWASPKYSRLQTAQRVTPCPRLSFSCHPHLFLTSLSFSPVSVNLRHPICRKLPLAQLGTPSSRLLPGASALKDTLACLSSLPKPLSWFPQPYWDEERKTGRTRQRQRDTERKNNANFLAQILFSHVPTSVQIRCWASSFPMLPQHLWFFRAALGTQVGKVKGMPTGQGSLQERSSILSVSYITILHKTMTEKKIFHSKKKSENSHASHCTRSDGGRHAPILKKPVGHPMVSDSFWQRATQEKLG